MEYKIALITSGFLEEYYKSLLKKLAPNMNISIIKYENYKNLPNTYAEVERKYDGFLVSGQMVKATIEKSKKVNKPIVYIESEPEALCALLLEILTEKPSVDMKRIVLDALIAFEDIDISCAGIWKIERQMEIDYKVKNHIRESDLQHIAIFEDKVFKRLKVLWEDGKIDFVVSMVSSIMEKMQKEGIPCAYAYPRISQVQGRLDLLCSTINIAKMRRGLPAIINIVNENVFSLENRNMDIDLVVMQKCLLDIKHDTMTEFIIQQIYTGFQIITDLQTLEKLTQNAEKCLIREYLEKHMSSSFYIGYGIGKDLAQARNHVERALNQSKQYSGSYLIDEKQRMMGPLGQANALKIQVSSNPEIEKLAGKAGLSVLTISRVNALCEEKQTRDITTHDMAQRLNMTTRNAYRILKAMEKAGLANVVGKQSNSVRGRPVEIYHIEEI